MARTGKSRNRGGEGGRMSAALKGIVYPLARRMLGMGHRSRHEQPPDWYRRRLQETQSQTLVVAEAAFEAIQMREAAIVAAKGER